MKRGALVALWEVPPPPLDDQDRLLLEALSHQRVAVLAQAAYWLGVNEQTARRRVRRLDRLGLLESRRLFDRGSSMLRITGRGLTHIGSPLGRPGQKLDEYRHDVGVAWVWTAAREGVFGELSEIHSERAMRSHDARLDRLSVGARALEPEPGLRGVGVGACRADGRPRRHYPDLLLESTAGHRIAVELELSLKGRRRLEHIMEAYASDSRIDGVLYLVEDARIGAVVRAAADRAGIAERVCVRGVARGAIGGVPALDRSAARAAHVNRGLSRTDHAPTRLARAADR